MRKYINETKQKFVPHFNDRSFVISCTISFVLLVVSLWISYYATQYANTRASNYVTDIILSNIRVFDVDYIFMYGPVVMWIFVGILSIHWPNKIPFILKSISLFIIIRSVFIILTHVGPFPGSIIVDPESLIRFFTSTGGDLFFSAHTGEPFLMALIFWQNKTLRGLFIIISVFFGIIVLLGHVHYTIDVASAFFITYSIYRLSVLGFKKDFARAQ